MKTIKPEIKEFRAPKAALIVTAGAGITGFLFFCIALFSGEFAVSGFALAMTIMAIGSFWMFSHTFVRLHPDRIEIATGGAPRTVMKSEIASVQYFGLGGPKLLLKKPPITQIGIPMVEAINLDQLIYRWLRLDSNDE